MRGFVYEETSRVGLRSMPASEVICPVGGIEGPFEMDRVYFADYSFAYILKKQSVSFLLFSTCGNNEFEFRSENLTTYREVQIPSYYEEHTYN